MKKVLFLALAMVAFCLSLNALQLSVQVVVANGGSNYTVRYQGEYTTPTGIVTFDRYALRNYPFGDAKIFNEPFDVPAGHNFYVTITATKTLPNGSQVVRTSGGQTQVVTNGQVLMCAPIIFP